MAIPTELATPWPSGPVVVSTPGVCPTSGCPAVFDPHCRKFSSSSRGRSYPVRWSSEYRSMDAWPADRTKRTRSHQRGLAGECFRCPVNRVYPTGARPMGAPGCPEFAFCTASMERTRTAFTQSRSSSVIGIRLSHHKVQESVLHEYNLPYGGPIQMARHV